MCEDYRNTCYCPPLGDITKKKAKVEEIIKSDHKRAKDMHRYLSRNEDKYKIKFIEAYNGKCAYCGVSIEVVGKRDFEIDHFLFEKSSRFDNSKAKAGYMDNLVLACQFCNRMKLGFEISDENADKIHPDKAGIKESFKRDEDYKIYVAKKDVFIDSFYNQLRLGDELRRIDFLLMSVKGLQKNLDSSKELEKVRMKLDELARFLQLKRNLA